jgi:hypothetical protein
MKKQKCLTLDTEVTDESEKKIKAFGIGASLSGLVENLLKKFNKGEMK